VMHQMMIIMIQQMMNLICILTNATGVYNKKKHQKKKRSMKFSLENKSILLKIQYIFYVVDVNIICSKRIYSINNRNLNFKI
jgi:hypothetical protein